MNINQIGASAEQQAKTAGIQNGQGARKAARANQASGQAAVYTAGMDLLPAADSGIMDVWDQDKTEEQMVENTFGDKDEKESLKGTSDSLTGKDCEELSEEGMSLEAYEATRINRALERMKSNQEMAEETMDQRMVKREEWDEEIERMAIANKISDPVAKKLAQKLVDSDLPVTPETMEQVLSALRMASQAGTLTDDGIAHLMQNGKEPSIENIYHSQYSGCHGKPVAEEIWNGVQGQAEDIIQKAGLEVSDETLQDARWMMEQRLPVTVESFERLDEFRSIRENYSEDMALGQIVKAMRQGLSPEDASLSLRWENKAADAVSGFEKVTENAVEVLIHNGQEVNLENLLKAGQEGAAEGVLKDSGEPSGQLVLSEDEALRAVSAKRQLEEIRLKMTQEAGVSLLKKGIRLDTSGLQKIVDGLRDLEDQYYKDTLKEAGAPVDEETLDQWKETSQKLDELKEMPEYLLGVTLKRRAVQTISSLHEVGVGLKARLDKAGESYEALMTAPRSDLGDSIQKAFQNVDDILKDMGLPETADNHRAIRILARNQMELSMENIQEVKAYDAEVQELLQSLKPAVAVEVIRRGENPLDRPIHELVEKAEAIRQEIGVQEEEKYSEFLYRLQKNQQITQEERKSYIGIYRLLHQVEKSDGAAIGAVMNSGRDLTLKNLLGAVRSRSSAGMDITVDDAFGALEELTFSRESISEQINAGFEHQGSVSSQTEGNASLAGSEAEQEYTVRSIHRILDQISPERISEVLSRHPEDWMELSVEELKDEISKAQVSAQENKEYYADKAARIRDIAAQGETALEFLKASGLETTIGNVAAAEAFFTGDRNLFKEIYKRADNQYAESAGSLIEAAESEEGLQAAYELAADQAHKVLDQEYQKGSESFESVIDLRLIRQGIELSRKLSMNEHYMIPIVEDGQITNVKLTVVKGTKDTGRIQVGVDSDSLGRMEAEFKITKQAINGFILCDSKDGLEAMTKNRSTMKQAFEALGLGCGQITAGLDKTGVENFRSQTAGNANTSEEKTKMDILYQAAQAVLKAVHQAAKEHSNS